MSYFDLQCIKRLPTGHIDNSDYVNVSTDGTFRI